MLLINMGSAASTRSVEVLKCPKGYDKEKFEKICQLFDRLDKDSNLGVSSDELTNIAALHVKNCQERLRNKIKAEQDYLERELRKFDEIQIQKIAMIRQMTEAAKEALRLRSEQAVSAMNNQLEDYTSLDQDGQENAFMKVLVPKDKTHIDFWTFFEYMKTRTQDIKNIKD